MAYSTSGEVNIANLRKEYASYSLDEQNVAADPIAQFEVWFNEAVEAQLPEPNAMTLATATKAGRPAARIVLLKGFDANGFLFYTNYDSRKGHELEENPQAALVFHWHELERQVRIEGCVEKLSRQASKAYFDTRPEKSRLGAWASPQSHQLESREALEQRFQEAEAKFQNEEIPLPESWGGYRLMPNSIEFWQGRRSRMHDRVLYTLDENNQWYIGRLAP
jgi:pyridoxamine 5'-phosphate oxidase